MYVLFYSVEIYEINYEIIENNDDIMKQTFVSLINGYAPAIDCVPTKLKATKTYGFETYGFT